MKFVCFVFWGKWDNTASGTIVGLRGLKPWVNDIKQHFSPNLGTRTVYSSIAIHTCTRATCGYTCTRALIRTPVPDTVYSSSNIRPMIVRDHAMGSQPVITGALCPLF